jgi:hypothetical protein
MKGHIINFSGKGITLTVAVENVINNIINAVLCNTFSEPQLYRLHNACHQRIRLNKKEKEEMENNGKRNDTNAG